MKKYIWIVLLVPLFVYASEKSSLSGRKNVNSWVEARSVVKESSESILIKGSGGPDSLGYRWTDEIPYNWIDITVIGDSIGAGDDWNDSVFYLADTFVFYGDTFDSLHICSNGWLSFTDTDDTYDRYPIPSTDYPFNLVAPYLTDLDPSDGGRIFYYADTLNNRTIIEWLNVPFYDLYDSTNTFEVILNSNDNTIIFQYNTAVWWSDTAVVGIQNGDGTVGLSVPSSNIDDGYALKFYRSAHNISLSSIEVPGSYVPADSTIYPVGIIKNNGLNPEGPFDVICQVDLGLTRIYTDTVSVLNLGVDSVDTIIFDPWSNSEEEGLRYNVTMFANLIGDDFINDDTLSLSTDVFQITNTISSRYASSPPNLDGFIGFEEWGSARRKDVTDILGFGAPVGFPPGQVYLYVMNDSLNLYLAIDGVYDLTADNEDAFCIYFDDNNDHSYPAYPDSTEGVLWLEWFSTGDSVHFAPVTSDSGELGGYSSSLPRGINKIPGNMQYEIAIPLDSPLYEGLQASAGDTIRTWLFPGDAYDYTMYGWWPTDDSIGWGDIDGMGEIVLSGPAGIEDDSDEYSEEYGFKLYQNTPNPFSGKTSITYEIPIRSFVSLKIYNATGQVIKIIAEGEKEAGRYMSVWDGYSEYGNKAPAGIYFYNLEADRNRITKKMILIR